MAKPPSNPDTATLLREKQRLEEALRAAREAIGVLESTVRDLTVREARFRMLFAQNPLMLFAVTRDGTVLAANTQVTRSLGYDPEEIEGGSVLRVFDPEDHEAVLAQIAQVLDQPGAVMRWSMRKIDRLGEPRWVNEIATTCELSPGHRVALIVCEDVTAERLRHQEHALHETLSVVYADARSVDHLLTRVVAEIAMICGWSIGEYWKATENGLVRAGAWVGVEAVRAFSDHRGADPLRANGIVATTWSRNGATWIDDIRLSTEIVPDDPEVLRYVRSAVALPVESSGAVIGTLAFFARRLDHRETSLAVLGALGRRLSTYVERFRRESAERSMEQHLSLALEAAGTGRWVVDLDAEMETRDATLNRILGLEAVPSTQPSLDYMIRVHPDDRATVRKRADIVREQSSFDLTYRLRRPDGELRWVRDVGRILDDGSGRRMLAGAVTDITDQVVATLV